MSRAKLVAKIGAGATALAVPLVMLYDPDVPRNEALLIDLADGALKIESAVNPGKLPLAAVVYLAPRGRVDYYIEGVH